MPYEARNIEKTIIDKAKEFGASLAGITSIGNLKNSPSYAIYDKRPYYDGYKGVKWNKEHKSVLVWALYHPASTPSLDWWSKKVPGFTPGNGMMQTQSGKLKIWLEEELGINATSLPYQIEHGGIFLKDSAHLAGLGVIGKNNLLVTKEFGPRIRLRGIFMEAELKPTGPIDFEPCTGCEKHCHQACPKDVFLSGSFDRPLCIRENDERNDNRELLDGRVMGIEGQSMVSKPCRICEYACPVGQKDI